MSPSWPARYEIRVADPETREERTDVRGNQDHQAAFAIATVLGAEVAEVIDER